MSLYAWREAKKVLDAFAEKHPSEQFRHAYRRLNLVVGTIAAHDYITPGACSEEEALSYLWQDVEMAFRAQAEASLGGSVLQMWANAHPEGKAFKAAIKKAFAAADKATPASVVRRYDSEVRSVDFFVGPKAYFDPVLPPTGPFLRAWAQDEGFSYEDLSREMSGELQRTNAVTQMSEQNTKRRAKTEVKSEPKHESKIITVARKGEPLPVIAPVRKGHLTLVSSQGKTLESGETYAD